MANTWGVTEAGEYIGAHVLSMVRAHYPLIDLKCLEAGYPKEVDPDKAEELQMTRLDLSAKIIGDINLCGGGIAPIQGTPSTSQLEAPSILSQPMKPAVYTSQASAGPSSSARPVQESPRLEQDVRSSEQQVPLAPTSQ